MSAGSASFAGGFTLAAVYNLRVFNYLSENQAELKLMRQILKDKHGLFSEAKAAALAAVAISNPLVASDVGAGSAAVERV